MGYWHFIPERITGRTGTEMEGKGPFLDGTEVATPRSWTRQTGIILRSTPLYT